VVFDSSSNATGYTATVDAVTGGIRMKALTIAGPSTGNVTLAGSAAIFIHDDVTFPATGMIGSYIGIITLTSSGTGRTFTSNGVNLTDNEFVINGVGCEWTLGSELNISTKTFTLTNGSFDTGGYNLTVGLLTSTNSNTRTLALGSSTVTFTNLSLQNSVNLTFNAGTSQINANANSNFNGGSLTFYNVSFVGTSAGTNITITGANTFNNLTLANTTASGFKNMVLSADQVINGTFTCSAGTNATMRHFVRSNTFGTTRTLTCNAVSLTDVDFRDITIAGSAAPAGGTRIGNCKGNSGITFTAATTRYWNLAGNNNWTATGWAASSGASPDINNFPLAQDTCVFESTSPGSGATITINQSYNIGTIDMSDRTSNTMTLATGSTTPVIHGNWINGTGITFTGTGVMTFAGRGSQTITSAGRTFTQAFTIDSPGGSVTLQDAFITNRSVAGALTLTQGTFDANGFNVTLSGAAGTFSSTNTNIRTVAVGSGTWTIAGNGTAWSCATSTNLTATGTGVIKLTSASAKTFAGGGVAYTDITLDHGGTGNLTITGNNTFKDIINTSGGATSILLANTTQRVAQWTATGTSGNVLTITGTSAASPATLILTGTTKPNVDFLTITGIRAYDLEDTWYAGANSTNNGSLGWYFEAAPTPPPVGGTGAMFLLFM
jgi:hypothetical protein